MMSIFCQYGSRKSLLDTPSASQALPHNIRIDPDDSTPIAQAFRFSVVFKKSSVGFIIRLFSVGRPTHIARNITTGIVNTIQRVKFRWAWTNMREEGSKRYAPFIADLNALVAVSFTSCWRMTSPFHIFPQRVFRSIRKSVRRIAYKKAFSLNAATRFRAFPVATTNRLDISTFARADNLAALNLDNRQPVAFISYGHAAIIY